MTDNDIMKVLNLCSEADRYTVERLEEELDDMEHRFATVLCEATGGILSKINYTNEVMICAINDHIQKCCEEAEAEAIKEFAERLKEHLCDYDLPNYHYFRAVDEETINEIAKEMAGERE